MNVFLYPTMPIILNGKNNVMVTCVPNPPVEPKCVVGNVRPHLRKKCTHALQEEHINAKTSNECKNGCFGPNGCTVCKNINDVKGC